jgi:putative tryptophan/tyrosine transport system substrate-binding protein
MMRRREFIAGLSSAAAWPMMTHAQQAAQPVIGYLSASTESADPRQTAAFRQGLRDLGYV